MHRRRQVLTDSRLQRFLFALLIAIGIATPVAVVKLHASGNYNDNPPYCRSHDPTDLLWWYYECWLPDDPDWGKER